MIDVIASWWSNNWLTLVLGSLICTALGAVGVALARTPIQRQRLAEATIGAMGLWLLFAIVPLPRSATPTPPPMQPWVSGATVEQSLIATPHVETVTLAVDGFDAMESIGVAVGIGSLLSVAYLLAALVVLARVRWRSSTASGALIDLCKSLELAPRRLRISLSRDTTRPFCCGLLRPTIVLPHTFATRSPQDLRPVLLHEFAHLAQGDLRGQTLFALALPVCFWNPLFWWLRKEARLCAEFIADDIAVRHFDRVTYVRKLIALAESTPMGANRHVATLGLLSHESEFFRRMKMLIQRQEPISSSSSGVQAFARRMGAIALAVTASSLWMAPELSAQDPTKPSKEAVAKKSYTAQVCYADDAELGSVVRKLAGLNFSIKNLDAEHKTMTFQFTSGDIEKALPWISKGARVVKIYVNQPKVKETSGTPPHKNSNRKTKANPNAPRVYFAFEDCDVNKIIDTIAKISGANIVVSPEVKGKATVSLKGVSWRTALAVTVEPLGFLVVEEDRGIIRIEAPKPGK